MKRIIAAIALGVILFAGAASAAFQMMSLAGGSSAAPLMCLRWATDTDGGFNPNVAGTCKDIYPSCITISHYDVCAQSDGTPAPGMNVTYLIEYYPQCVGDQCLLRVCSSSLIHCMNGCWAARCL